MFLFGMSTSFWTLLISRCFQGVFNGNIGVYLHPFVIIFPYPIFPGVSKSIIAEVCYPVSSSFQQVTQCSFQKLTDSTNRGDAYAYMPMMWSFGTTSGSVYMDLIYIPVSFTVFDRPIIGGVLSNAAQRWPSTLGRIHYLQDHPYFLPCAVAGLLAFVAFAISFLSLKEVSNFSTDLALFFISPIADFTFNRRSGEARKTYQDPI